MKELRGLLGLSLGLVAFSSVAFAADVTVTEPTSDETVSTSFTLLAQSPTCDAKPTVSMAYSIDNGADSIAVAATSLKATVSTTIGASQVLHVKSWNGAGNGCDTDVTINVTASGGVSITAPTANESVSSSFQLQATSATCDGQKVVTMAYSIGGGANSPAVSGTSLNTTVSASLGSNQVLHVKSWGSAGAGCDQDVTINVLGFDGSLNIPQPSSNALVNSRTQELTDWSSSTGAASSCPNGVVSSTCHPPNANYDSTVLHVADPLELSGSPNSSALFEFENSPAYATAIWAHQVTTLVTARNFIWDFYVYVNGTNYESSELDLYQSMTGGARFMMGSQCNRADDSWDTWSDAKQEWIHNTSIPCNTILTAGAWHHVTMYNTTTSSASSSQPHGSYTYHVIRIDNVDYVLNQTQLPAPNVDWPAGLIGVQVQLDANASGAGVHEYIEMMQLYAW
jgi:hypothetical protein